MSKIEVNQKVKEIKLSLIRLSNTLINIAQRFDASRETVETLKEQVEHIQENFLFVIVGEVNAGKSSFVNALLGVNVCETSHEICTREVQEIVYGNTETILKDSSKRIVRREYPADILKEITIVDTPGTNSREIDHQIITEKFIPYCNLVVFVFQMDNIHVQSAWELFRKIKDQWSKKVIFVLTKADRYSPDEVGAYKNSLTRYAQNEHIEQPLIFITSALKEKEGQLESSGFQEIRNYINQNVLNTAAVSKVADDLKTLKILRGHIDQEFGLRKQRFENDQFTRQKINNIIKNHEDLAQNNISGLVSKSTQAFDRNTETLVDELNNGIGLFSTTFRSFKAMFGGESTHKWFERIKDEYISKLNQDINEILEAGKEGIKSDIQYMVMGVKDELANLKDTSKTPRDMFGQIDLKRGEIIDRLRYNLTDFIEKSPVFKGESFIKGQVDYTGVGIAGGIAAIGSVITYISQASVADITGGIATAFGLLLAGGLMFTQKGKFIRKVKEAADENKAKLKTELEQNLKSYLLDIKQHINRQFEEFDHHLKTEELQVNEYTKQMNDLNFDLTKVENELI
jgi:small GTP-binding protein